jgi:hypothetical protein
MTGRRQVQGPRGFPILGNALDFRRDPIRRTPDDRRRYTEVAAPQRRRLYHPGLRGRAARGTGTEPSSRAGAAREALAGRVTG